MFFLYILLSFGAVKILRFSLFSTLGVVLDYKLDLVDIFFGRWVKKINKSSQ